MSLSQPTITRPVRGAALVALAIACAGVVRPQYTISTLAGNGPASGSAATAFAMATSGVAVDANQNVYIPSANCNCVYRVDASHFATIVVGNGSRGYGGEGGPAANAMMSGPTGVALDSAGNLYIADTFNNVIRKVTVTNGAIGNISTVAGNGTPGYAGDGVSGGATGAELNGPQAMAVDASGNLYIADTGNNAIREVLAASNTIITIAGGTLPAVQLKAPSGVAVDGSSPANVYIADAGNNVIREWSGGVMTLAAGNGTAGFAGDGVAGGATTVAELNHPLGVMVDGSGNLYIGDTYNERVRKVTGGTIVTVAGNGSFGHSSSSGIAATAAPLGGPNGMALDGSGNLYIADSFTDYVEIVSRGLFNTLAGNGWYGFSGDSGPALISQIYQPSGVAVDSTRGFLYIADTYNLRIRQVNLNNGVITTVAGNGHQGFSPPSGASTPATSFQLNLPSGVAVDSSGNLYIADTFNHVIEEVTMTAGVPGNIITVAGTGTAGYNGESNTPGVTPATAELNYPWSVALDGEGNIYIADSNNYRIREVSPATNTISTLAGNGTAGYQDGPASSAEFFGPTGLAIDGSGVVYVADPFNGAIRKVAGGNVTTVAGPCCSAGDVDGVPATSTSLGNPYSVAVDPLGNLYIAQTNGFEFQAIRKVNAAGTITTIAGKGTPGFSGDGGPATLGQINRPFAVTLDSSSNVYIAELSNSRIRQLTPVGTTISSLSPASAAAEASMPLTMTVTGANFVNGDLVLWTNGSASTLATTFVSGTELTASVPVTLLATAGTANVSIGVFGGGTSGALPFTIQAVVPNVVGLSQAVATTAITNAGLNLGALTYSPSTTVPSGDVISQNPRSGALANAGAPVGLEISTGSGPPPPMIIPPITETIHVGDSLGSPNTLISAAVIPPIAEKITVSDSLGSPNTLISAAVIPPIAEKITVSDSLGSPNTLISAAVIPPIAEKITVSDSLGSPNTLISAAVIPPIAEKITVSDSLGSPNTLISAAVIPTITEPISVTDSAKP